MKTFNKYLKNIFFKKVFFFMIALKYFCFILVLNLYIGNTFYQNFSKKFVEHDS